jgi:hypothetical protein
MSYKREPSDVEKENKKRREEENNKEEKAATDSATWAAIIGSIVSTI